MALSSFSRLFQACLGSPCKVINIATEKIRKQIVCKLAYKKNCMGRALGEHIPQLSLQKYDRLLPTKTLPDVAAFETILLPFICHFWRICKNDRVIHPSPLLTDIPGCSYDSWVVDGLHAWALGPLSAYVSTALHFCMRSKVFAPQLPYTDLADCDRLSLVAIKALLQVFYRKRKSDEDWKRTGVYGT